MSGCCNQCSGADNKPAGAVNCYTVAACLCRPGDLCAKASLEPCMQKHECNSLCLKQQAVQATLPLASGWHSCMCGSLAPRMLGGQPTAADHVHIAQSDLTLHIKEMQERSATHGVLSQ
eukprot:GHRR01020990.1.p2 GENE.GHRR01020990.1~~GHRR01020990.1.p2  ORF type:complete len:119 (-),score=28.71 GHRR01020990.1:1262-1618(-)